MIKKTRININTSFKIYIKVFLSFIFNTGKKNKKYFEKLIRNYFFTDNILLTSQGRVAAFNIFKVILSEKKKEILISPYTLTEVINSIIYAGGKPVYVEINLKNGLPLENDLNKKINENTAGLVITHLYSNKEDILNFHKKYNGKIKIIEDVAINFGAKIDEHKFLGTLFDYGFYSFGIMKHLCTFHGGAIYCKEKSKLYEIEKNLAQNIDYPIIASLKLVFFCMFIDFLYNKYIYHFFTHYILLLSVKKLEKLMNPNVYPKFFKIVPDHYNYKFQDSFAIAGIENLKSLETKINSKIKKVKLYENYLDKSLRINNFNYYDTNSFLEFPIVLNKNNNKFLHKELLKIGYDIRHTWYVNSVRYLNLDFSLDNFSNCEFLHEKVLSLPTHDQILEKDIIRICELINLHENDEII
jgi:perosamine synthetase